MRGKENLRPDGPWSIETGMTTHGGGGVMYSGPSLGSAVLLAVRSRA